MTIPGGGGENPALHIQAIFRPFQVRLEWYQKPNNFFMKIQKILEIILSEHKIAVT